jgi:magnesium-transporting ATPase (P-type)
MIQEADIGVGISGVEGMQVGNISDWLFLQNGSLNAFDTFFSQFKNSYTSLISKNFPNIHFI